MTAPYMYNSLIRYELTNLRECRCECAGVRVDASEDMSMCVSCG
jgi:hypothetical protein